MNTMTELVDLPDPTVSPLVHPLDVPQARRQFRNSWLIDLLTRFEVGLCLAVVIWFFSDNFIVPVLAGAAMIGFGYLAGRYAADQSWEYIPGKRQDRQRPLPLAWEIASEFVFCVTLSAALLLIVVGLDQRDVASEITHWVLGSGIAVAVLVVADFLIKRVRNRGRENRRAWLTLGRVLSLVITVAVACAILFRPSVPDAWMTLAWGAGTMLVAEAVVEGSRYVQKRRS